MFYNNWYPSASTSRCSNDTSWYSGGRGGFVTDLLRRVGTNARLHENMTKNNWFLIKKIFYSKTYMNQRRLKILNRVKFLRLMSYFSLKYVWLFCLIIIYTFRTRFEAYCLCMAWKNTPFFVKQVFGKSLSYLAD
jgi:fatty acid desaturase